MVEHWNIGLQKDLSNFRITFDSVNGGTIVPIFQYSSIPLVSVIY